MLALGVGFDWLGALANPLVVLAIGPGPTGEAADPSMLPVYFGSVLPVLGLFSLCQPRRSRGWTWAVAGAGLLCLGVSLGASPAVARLALRPGAAHPLLSSSHDVPGILHPRCGDARRRGQPPRAGTGPGGERKPRVSVCDPWPIVAGVCAVVSMAAVGWNFSATTNEWAIRFAWVADLHTGLAWCGLAAVCAATARWTGCRRWLPAALVVISVLDLTATYVLSRRMVYTVEPGPAESRQPAPVADLGPAGFPRYLGKYNNDNFYRPHPTFVSYTAMTNEIVAAWRQDNSLLLNVIGPRRVWFSPAAPRVPPSSEAFAAFCRRVHEVRGLVLLRHDPTAMLDSGSSQPLTDPVQAAIAAAPRAAARRL